MPYGKTLGYDELAIGKAQYTLAARALERLQKEGLIKKVSNEVVSKPEKQSSEGW